MTSSQVFSGLAARLVAWTGVALICSGLARAGEPVPVVALQAPATVLLGGSFGFTVTLDNTSTDTTGYGPFVDIAYDATGPDGVLSLPYDGLSILTSVQFLGSALPASYVYEFTFDDTANGGLGVAHPLAKDSSGNPVYVKTTDFAPPGRFQNGDKFLVVQIPLGSFTPEQPLAALQLTAQVSNLADVGTPLPISVRGGFMFGKDPLDNPTTDPAIFGAQADSDPYPQPTLIRLTKTYVGPEDETATGPNFLRRYRLTVDVADGQTIADLHVVDLVPNTEQFTQVITATRASGSGSISPVSVPSTSVPGGTLDYNFGTVVGTASASDVVLEYEFFVPRVDSNGDPVLDPTSGDDRFLCNQAYTYGDWTPIDTRDSQTRVAAEALVSGTWPDQTVTPDEDCEHRLEAQSIAIQKSVAIVNDVPPSGMSPGDTLEYTLAFQVSDYFAFQAVRIDDIISDGQRWDTTFTPTMTVTEHGTTLGVAGMNSANYTVTPNYTPDSSPPNDGTTAIQFRISDELVTRGVNANLVGGGIHSDTTGLEPDNNLQNNPPLPWGGTVGTVTFRTVVQDKYSDDYPSGNDSLNPRDGVSDSAVIYGELLDPADLSPIGTSETDDTGAGLSMPETALAKSIYAINGDTTLPSPVVVRPGDTVTFRLEMPLRTGDVEIFTLSDFVPLPIFDVGDPDADGSPGPAWSKDTSSNPVPAAGQWKYGPTDTLHLGGDLNPAFADPTVTINTSSGNNTIYWDFGTYDDPNNTPRKADILFTLAVNNEPFADNLLLMNQARSRERDTDNGINYTDVITPFYLFEPVVNIYKGVIASDREGGRTLGGVEFAPPGATTALASGQTLTTQTQSDAVAAADLTSPPLPDANDRVRYGVVLFNSGRSDAYDVTMTDTIPAAYLRDFADASAFAAGVNLIVQRGGGSVLTLGTDYLLSWDNVTKTFTVELVDNYAGTDPGIGGLNRGRNNNGDPTTDGSNAVIVSYDLTLVANVPANSTIVNTATLTKYAGAEGGPNHIPGGLTDDANVRTPPPVFLKTVTGTEISGTGNGQFQAVVGEMVTYTLTVTVPEGLTPNAVIDDTLHQGMAFVQLVSMTPSSGVTVANTPPTVSILDPGVARQVRFTLGDIQNNNTGNSGSDTVILVFQAIVLNQNTLPSPPGNQDGVTLDNTAQFTYSSGPALDSSPAQLITIVEPTLTLAKQIAQDVSGSPGTFADTLFGQDAGNIVYYQVVITHTGGPAAFDLGLSDAFSTKLTSLTVYSATSSGTTVNGTVRSVTTADFAFAGQNLGFASGVNIDLDPTGSITVVVRATIDASVITGEIINNQATVTWSSMDGDFTSPRSAYNTSSTERTGAGGVGSDTDVLDNYAAQNSTSTGVLNAAVPVLYKEIVATSESDTAQTRVLVDFTNTGFDGWTPGSDFTGGVNTWQTAGNTTLFPQFIRIGGTATERGGGFFTYSAPNYLDLRGYLTIGAMVRANTGNGATPLWIQLTDADGTVFRLALAASPAEGRPGFSQLVSASLLSPTAVVSAGSIPGLDLAQIAKLELRGDNNTSAMRMDIDRLYAMRTLAAPGEIVRYRLTAQIPEGTLPDFAISELLPPGMRFINDGTVRVAFVANGDGIASSGAGSGGAAVPALTGPGLNLTGSGDDVSSFSLAVGGANGLVIGEGTGFDANVSNSRTADTDTYSDGTDVWFRLGTLVNSDNDTDAEYVVIEFNALVTNDRDGTATNGSAQQAGVGLSNTFRTHINSSTTNTQVGSTSTANDFQAVVIVEPQINNLSKTITTVPLDAGDPISYEIKFSNNSAHPAQHAPQVRAATTTAFSATFNASGGMGGTGRYTGAPATVDGVTLAEGDRVLVKDQAVTSQNGIYKVVDTINGIWDRATDFDTAAEMNLGYRAYVVSGTSNGGKTFALDATVTTINTDPVSFSEVAANPAVRVATTANLSGFSAGTFIGVSATQDGVTLAVGDRVLVRAQSTANQNGVYVVTSVAGGNMNMTRAADFDAAAEFPVGIQVFVSEGTRCGGRTFAQTATVTTINTSSITWVAVDPVTAFDLVLTDALPSDVLFQSVTITTPALPAGQTFTTSGTFTGGSVSVPAVGSSGTITVNLDSLAPESKITGTPKDVTIVVNGTVVASGLASREIVNRAALTFTSLPGSGTAPNPTGSTTPGASGDQYGERNGSGVTATDNTPVNYNTTQRNNYSVAATAITSLNDPMIDKSFKDGTLTDDDTSLASTTGADAAVGEQVTYDILVTLPEGNTPDLVVNDILPVGLRLDSYTVVTTTAGSARLSQNFNGTLALNPPTVVPALPASGPVTVSFSFGDCTASADGNPNNDAFVLRLTATVLNVAANQEGVTRLNTATLRYDDPAIPDRIVPDNNPANDPAITVVEPLLTINKQVDAALVDAGDEVTYTFTISNSGSQAAYNVTLLDAIPAVIRDPAILTGVGDFSATGFYDPSVVAATTVDLGATFNPTGGSQNKGAFSGAPTVLDTSVTLADNDLVLVKDQTAPEQNGIYLVIAAATGDWERWASFDEAAEMLAGYRVHVAGGATHAGQVWVLMANVETVNTDPVNWAYYADVQAPTVNDFEISGGTLQVKPSFTLNVPPNASITLKVKGTVADSITPGQSIPNTAGLAWTSIQGVTSDERTGADGPGGTLNDYAANSLVTSKGNAASFAKSLFATDQTETSDPNVTIGEFVTYALKVTLPEGATPDLSVTDNIPAGLKYESYMLVLTASGSGGLLVKDFAGNVPTPSFSGGGASGDDVTFTFGAITVTGNNDPDDNSFLILVTARVVDEIGNVGFQPGQTTLSNNATFDISDDGIPPFTTPDVNTPIVEPRMTITKNIVQTGADAGDVLDIELTVHNTGLLTAYDVVIEDPLNPAKFNPATVNFGTAGVDYPAGFTPSVVGNTVTYTGGNLPVGGPYLFKFKVALTTTVAPAEVVNNTATVTQATTLEGVEPAERNEPPVNSSDTVTIFSHGLSGYVYHDPNNNGLKETGESPIGGVTITLTGTDHLGNPVNLSTVTGPDGYYEFVGLRPGTYIITETQPAGWLDGKETSGTPWTGTVDNTPGSQTITAITIPTGTPSTMGEDYNFGEIKPASIGNRVWLDENSDGYQDAGEPGIANVQVNLYDANGNLVAWTLTDANGGYLFTNLAPGTYYVDVLDGTGGQSYTLPFGGMTQTPPSTLPGADFGNQDHGTTTIPNTSLTGYQVTVGDGGENLTADFGYNYNPATDVNGNTGTAALGDRVWIDADGDGFQDVGEVGLGGVTVNLYSAGSDGIFGTADDQLVASTTTDLSGQYIFTGLAVGGYVVEVAAPAGYTQTGDPDHFGTVGTNDNKTTVQVVLGPGDVFLNADFGYQPAESESNSVGDYVWLDGDADGVQDSGEYGIAGVTVALIADVNGNGVWDGGEPVIGSTMTDANGAYLFSGLPDGMYLVWVNDTDNVLAGKSQTYDSDGVGTPNISAVDLDSAGNSAVPVNDADQDFGYTPVGQTSTGALVGDRVWLDIDGDGVQDAGEPGIEGVRVELYGPGNVLISVTYTDENGYYYFGGLPAGTGTIVVVPPSGMTQTYDADGLGTANQSTVTISAGEINLLQDFGYRGAGSIGNLVWEDRDADGLRDAGESGIGGVTLDLYWDLNGNGVIDPGEPRVGSTATAPDGSYLFGGLPTDDGSGDAQYVVVVTDTAGVLDGWWHSLGIAGQDNNSQTDPYAVTLTPAVPNNTTADFGYFVKPAGLGNWVWNDLDGDGIQDPIEQGIPGVTVTLVITWPDNSTTTLVTTTDSQGYYTFDNLLLDEDYDGVGSGEPTFSISVATPTGGTPSPINQGSDDTIDSDDHTGQPAAVVKGTFNDTYDFGYEPTATLALLADIKLAVVEGRLEVQWTTASEVGTVAFDLFRQASPEAWVLVNPEPILAANVLTGADYAVLDAAVNPPGPYRYRLIEWQSDGSSRLVGEFELRVEGWGDGSSAPRITSLHVEGGQARIRWTGRGGRFRIEVKESLSGDSPWERVEPIWIAPQEAKIPANGSARFFRVVSETD
ncbi:MAG: DUF11 domain-containing protein [Verrucomicrobia bacterium]|nr:DUF11 domain-containing protein [Verrucomicrobiota bacterium]